MPGGIHRVAVRLPLGFRLRHAEGKAEAEPSGTVGALPVDVSAELIEGLHSGMLADFWYSGSALMRAISDSMAFSSLLSWSICSERTILSVGGGRDVVPAGSPRDSSRGARVRMVMGLLKPASDYGVKAGMSARFPLLKYRRRSHAMDP